MAAVSYQIETLLEKMQSADKDFRFMATNDLMAELQKDSIKLDDDLEKKVVKMALKLIEDKNGEVQSMAVKCLVRLVNKVKESQVDTIVQTLCCNMVSDKELLREISSVALKTVIVELHRVSEGLLGTICKQIIERLTSATEGQKDVTVQLEALDLLAELLSRFGINLQSFHGPILSALLPQLRVQRQAVRKRTIAACDKLVLCCNSAVYDQLIEHLHAQLKSEVDESQIRTYVQCVTAVCRQSGHKFARHVERFVHMIYEWSIPDNDELRECCLQAFESFVMKCPKEITPSILKITERCLVYMTHDPNYNYNSEDENGDRPMEVEEEDEEEGEQYSDFDDMSWKVRRSAAKCLESIISTRRELLPDFYRMLSGTLVSHFKEREENVKADIFHAYIALLRQTRASMDQNQTEKEKLAIDVLRQQVPTVVSCIQRQMRERSIKTRQNCFQLLKELCGTLPAAFTNQIPRILPGIMFSLRAKSDNSSIRIDALSFIHCLLTSHPPEAFHPHMTSIFPPIILAVGDQFYKITAEALNVLEELVKVIRPLNVQSTFDCTPFVEDTYSCTLLRLKATDIDQEVKEKAISTMGQIICSLGDHLAAQLPECLILFLHRLLNEVTRLAAVKALTKIAGSPLGIELSIMEELFPVLGPLLRKNQRALKLSVLQLVDCLIKNYHRYMYVDLLHPVIMEVPQLLDEYDLHIAQYTLMILTSIAEHHPRALQDLSDTILPKLTLLLKSPLLQGTALTSMLDLFKAIVRCNLTGVTCTDLVQFLIYPVAGENEFNEHKQAYYSVAKCVAAIICTDRANVAQMLPVFVDNIQTATHDSQKMFMVLVVGEIGREVDLSSFEHLNPILLHAFSSVSDDVKSAASYALGSICTGNLHHYLPLVLAEGDGNPMHQYLLLNSLKEVIRSLSSSQEGVDQLLPFVSRIWDQLFRYCESGEEGTRNVVAECLGKLTLVDPAILLPKLQKSLDSQSSLMRTTVVTAVKFTISDQPARIDPLLRQCIGEFLNTMEDADLNVRRVALMVLNSAAHNKPSLIRDLLDTVLPQLYSETDVKRELIREVEMGPFKHTVDDGLDIRKTAFECMYTLLDSCLDRIDIFEFIGHVENGLKDHYDIKMLTHMMVTRLSQICPEAVLQNLDRLVQPLKATCTMKINPNSVKQEYEKQSELNRSALRAVAALLAIPDANKNPQLSEFVAQVQNTSDLRDIFQSVQRDKGGAKCEAMDHS